ncbi:hypothetical protein [Enterobacter kobei]|uniref:hypothetical protein n=1 Tax=Enterobacter kobei TaxID=208224 RepID=UPI0011ED7BF7|nr:hypothetical protein [Enterobacter kobei]ELQ3772971.1 hypothetical protein [Enterobacter kobei]QEO02538.1 hypothetical protein FZO55_18145 [Enterobacter kobei]
MEEFKGTPGPWKYTIRNVNEMMTTFHGVVMGDTYIEIATRNEREDAQLISAAPEMLQALQLMISAQVLPVYHQTIANAAINKALGK